MSGIVTPEAVRLDFAYAGIGSRAAALLIDAAVVIATLILVSIGASALFSLSATPDWVAVSTLLILNFLLLFGYPIVCEVAFSGRTLGKLALGLRVVTHEGAPVGLRHAAIRSSFMLIDFFLTVGAGAMICAGVTQRSQRLGDLVAGTVVLRQRQAVGPVRVVEFPVPPGADGYAATVSSAIMRPEEYQRVRSFLIRTTELEPSARQGIATTLAAPFLAMTPAPPEGMDPATYLQVLAAVYQRGVSHTHTPPPTPAAVDSQVGGGFQAPQ